MTQLAKQQYDMDETPVYAPHMNGQLVDLPVRGGQHHSEKKTYCLLPKEEAACNAATD